MAVGDAAAAAGYPLVPGTGEAGKRKYGAQEINRTRDMIAELERQATSYGPGDPSNADGNNGDLYFKVL
jgi:hypothetical protein